MLVFVTMLFTLKPPMGITTTTTVQVLKFCGVLYLGLTWLLKHIILIRWGYTYKRSYIKYSTSSWNIKSLNVFSRGSPHGLHRKQGMSLDVNTWAAARPVRALWCLWILNCFLEWKRCARRLDKFQNAAGQVAVWLVTLLSCNNSHFAYCLHRVLK